MTRKNRFLLLFCIFLIVFYLFFQESEQRISFEKILHFIGIELKLPDISKSNVLKEIDLSNPKTLKKWKNKIFKGKTKYWLDLDEEEKFLHSKSNKTASALYYRISYKIKNYPKLRWKWRPKKFPKKDRIHDPELKDDYALRLYVIFASGFFTNYKCVEYIWDETLPEGTELISPYSDKIRQLVIRSGGITDDWKTEERNVLEDYEMLFGKKPRLRVRAIAVMTDSEGTKDSSEANFKEITIFR